MYETERGAVAIRLVSADGDEGCIRRQWDDWPDASIYHSDVFLRFLRNAIPGQYFRLLAEDERGQVLGVLPFAQLDRPGVGTVINSLPWYGSHGGCLLAEGESVATRTAMLACFRDYLDGLSGLLSATIILTPLEQAHVDQYCEILRPVTSDRRIGQVTELPVDGNALETRLLQKTRNLVRKALRQSFVLSVEDDDSAWNFLYLTHAENMAGIGGKAKPREHFQALRRSIPESRRRLYVAHLEGEPVAGLLLLYHNRTVEYITPVIKQAYRSAQPLSFLIWHAMLDAISAGFGWWNWGGTWASQQSLHHFKEGWGAEDRPYTYLVCASSEGRERLAMHKHMLADLFPYYYAYPYAELGE